MLEAMKLVFNQPGFVFCLMVNADYLENLAQHRFGVSTSDEKYLDKFVDIRLRLEPQKDAFKKAVYALALELPIAIPYADDESFSLEHAADLASNLAIEHNLSFRMVKRIFLKVEIALRCYSDRAFDVSLLIFLAFQNEVKQKIRVECFPRSFLTPQEGEKQLERVNAKRNNEEATKKMGSTLYNLIKETAPELMQLPEDRYKLPKPREKGGEYYPWAKAFKFLAPHYIPSHQDALNAVASIMVPMEERSDLGARK